MNEPELHYLRRSYDIGFDEVQSGTLPVNVFVVELTMLLTEGNTRDVKLAFQFSHSNLLPISARCT